MLGKQCRMSESYYLTGNNVKSRRGWFCIGVFNFFFYKAQYWLTFDWHQGRTRIAERGWMFRKAIPLISFQNMPTPGQRLTGKWQAFLNRRSVTAGVRQVKFLRPLCDFFFNMSTFFFPSPKLGGIGTFMINVGAHRPHFYCSRNL